MAAAFREGFVDADGFRIRYMEAGDGTPLVHLHGAGGLRLNPSHDLLAQKFRVIAFEMPGFGSAENTRTANMQELAATIPYEPGPKVISRDEQGDPLYEDAGLTPRLMELTRKHRRQLEAELERSR